MRVLELGSYIIPAYAGMVLAEQGHEVEKWTWGVDPIQELHRGDELWDWINHGKTLVEKRINSQEITGALDDFDVVIENIRADTWRSWVINPPALSKEITHRRHPIVWVSMRTDTPDDHDGVSFDVIGQARSWMEYTNWTPFYAGDTTGGLWMAFKALSAHTQNEYGYHELHQASLMQKLVEGELVIDEPPHPGSTRWDHEPYGATQDGALINYRGTEYHEPVRNREWKLDHLHHIDGRIIV
jgi:crotonobetainyl-CoA:carnitine CoA-transferase CaiB-like acyl-CoA transferase